METRQPAADRGPFLFEYVAWKMALRREMWRITTAPLDPTTISDAGEFTSNANNREIHVHIYDVPKDPLSAIV